MTKPGQGRTPEQQREWWQSYRKARREGRWVPKPHAQSTSLATKLRSEAAYDPQRDGERFHDSITAVLMGDPPVGRRAIDRGEL